MIGSDEGARVEMKVRVSNPALVQDLVEFLGRARCRTAGVHGAVVEVELPGVSDSNVARRDLGLYLAAWRGLHPPAEARILD
jgi:hypothetical protein